MIIEYVVGLVFPEEETGILLIEKNRPEWQKGKLNGVGGHVEEYDISIRYAMTREFEEEAGVYVDPNEWDFFLKYEVPGVANINFFSLHSQHVFDTATSMTDEKLKKTFTNGLDCVPVNCIDNLRWIIPLAAQSHQYNLVKVEEKNET